MSKHYLYLSHVISQLIYKWVPPIIGGERRSDCEIYEMTQSDWAEIVESTIEQWEHLVPNSCKDRVFRNNCEILSRAALENLHLLRANGGSVIYFDDADYPKWLQQIPDPPLCLFFFGDRTLFNYPTVSIIGSRKSMGFSLKESFKVAQHLAAKDIAVVSGGAIGCDIASHQGVLNSNKSPAPAICVLSGGLCDFYPKRNASVFAQIQKGSGIILSERLWWAKSRPMDFRIRNRIIAGLSPITLVMQAGEKSGALITAMYAIDQGREVTCLLHDQDDCRAQGTQKLIDMGAPFFQGSREDLEFIEEIARRPLMSQEINQAHLAF